MKIPFHQQVRNRFQLGPAYHMTHVENLGPILKAAALRSYNRMKGQYASIANDDVQLGRAGIVVSATGRPLHDYVPLYFGFKTPMVACNQHQNEQLIFLRFSLDLLEKITGIVISDGNARSGATQFRLYRTIDDLSVLDVKAVLAVRYGGAPEAKRRKQAELLVPDELPVAQILDIICFSDHARNTVITTQRQHGMSIATLINPGWYFTPTPERGA